MRPTNSSESITSAFAKRFEATLRGDIEVKPEPVKFSIDEVEPPVGLTHRMLIDLVISTNVNVWDPSQVSRYSQFGWEQGGNQHNTGTWTWKSSELATLTDSQLYAVYLELRGGE